jgi:ADP-ribose pyrophosphatase YjhB (NUDIX family)
VSPADGLLRVALRVVHRLRLAWWFLRRPRTQSVSVAVWCGRRVLLVRQTYRRELGLPGGGLRRGETPAEAAARELREETGIDVEPGGLRPAGELFDESEWKRDRALFFEARLDAEPALRPDGREILWAGFVPVERLREVSLREPFTRFLAGEARASGSTPR